MTPAEDRTAGVEETIERLICRSLDGELAARQQAHLDRILAGSPAARAMLEDYRRNDALAAEALARDLGGVRSLAQKRRYRGWRLGAASAILTAAAVVAFSLLPSIWSAKHPVVTEPVPPPSTAARHHAEPSVGQLIDYREFDYRPLRRHRAVQRDLIGIRDEQKDVIYIIERNTPTVRIVPISGEF